MLNIPSLNIVIFNTYLAAIDFFLFRATITFNKFVNLIVPFLLFSLVGVKTRKISNRVTNINSISSSGLDIGEPRTIFILKLRPTPLYLINTNGCYNIRRMHQQAIPSNSLVFNKIDP